MPAGLAAADHRRPPGRATGRPTPRCPPARCGRTPPVRRGRTGRSGPTRACIRCPSAAASAPWRGPGAGAGPAVVAARRVSGCSTRTPSSSPPRRRISAKRDSSKAVETVLDDGTTPVRNCGRVAERDDLVRGAADGRAERRGDRRRQRLAGHVAGRHQRQIILRQHRNSSIGSRAGRGSPRQGRRGCCVRWRPRRSRAPADPRSARGRCAPARAGRSA